MTMIDRLVLRDDAGAIRSIPDLVQAVGPGPWLCVSPHDDDVAIGMGLTVAAACAAGIEVHIGVVSDGGMGYPRPEDQATIAATRHAELLASCAALGIPAARVHELGLPDGELVSLRGVHRSPDGRHGGVGRAITALMRRVRPTVVFGPNPADVHPDHQAVAADLDIACFWAASAIWSELGAPITLPVRWDYAVYAPFPADPHLRLEASAACRAAKAAAFAAFASQQYVAAQIAVAPPVEHLRRVTWTAYQSTQYDGLFQAAGPSTAFDADCRLLLEALAAWPAAPFPEVRRQFAAGRPFLLVGEGSSQLMPGGFLRACARTWGWGAPVDAVGGRAAQAMDLSRHAVVCASNSGRSREVVEAMPGLPGDASALVGIPGGPLTRLPHRVLLPRPEAAVPATSSVLLTCLALGHALADACGKTVPLAELRAALRAVLDDPRPLEGTLGIRRVFWVGSSAGVGSELGLKTMEATGLPGLDLPGSLGLHGIHEVLEPGDLVVGYDIAPADRTELHRRVETMCGARLHLPAFPDLGPWTALLQLAHGWRVLAAIAVAIGRDPAVPRRATKIGNPAG